MGLTRMTVQNPHISTVFLRGGPPHDRAAGGGVGSSGRNVTPACLCHAGNDCTRKKLEPGQFPFGNLRRRHRRPTVWRTLLWRGFRVGGRNVGLHFFPLVRMEAPRDIAAIAGALGDWPALRGPRWSVLIRNGMGRGCPFAAGAITFIGRRGCWPLHRAFSSSSAWVLPRTPFAR